MFSLNRLHVLRAREVEVLTQVSVCTYVLFFHEGLQTHVHSKPVNVDGKNSEPSVKLMPWAPLIFKVMLATVSPPIVP